MLEVSGMLSDAEVLAVVDDADLPESLTPDQGPNQPVVTV